QSMRQSPHNRPPQLRSSIAYPSVYTMAKKPSIFLLFCLLYGIPPFEILKYWGYPRCSSPVVAGNKVILRSTPKKLLQHSDHILMILHPGTFPDTMHRPHRATDINTAYTELRRGDRPDCTATG